MARALVPLAQGCEELEAITIVDLLRRAGIEVIIAGLDARPVVASRGTRIIPDTELDRVKGMEFDVIVLPGGLPGADYLQGDPRIARLLHEISGQGGITAAICAAPKVLAASGLLDGKRATCYPGVLKPETSPQTLLSPEAVVRDGNVITSRGPGTAMDFALELIEALLGKEQRIKVETALVR